jgi:hypothetical protein
VAHSGYLDSFEFVDLMLEGSHPNQRLILLFRRIGSECCLWGSRSPSLWSRQDDPDLDWLPLDPRADVDEYVDLLFRRLDAQLWPLYIQDDGPCNPDASGISWTAWQLSGS